MHHKICQHVYIPSTASGHIVDTLEFSPHYSPMPQLSSADRLFMTSNDMTNQIKSNQTSFILIALAQRYFLKPKQTEQ
jgi:hypothetical protein